jgi:Zn-dependent protease
LFALVSSEVRRPRVAAQRWWLLPVSAVVFLGAARLVWNPRDAAVVLGVIAAHELGHYVAMRLVGYRDVRVFFVPFLGAATTGTREDAEAWQRSVVALAGPTPGIVAALVLTLALPDPAFATWHRAVTALLIVNGFNLLPFEPLDGGRVMSTLVFSRGRWSESLFGAMGGLGLIGIAWLADSIVLGLFGVFLVALAPSRHRLRKDAIAVASRFPNIAPRIEEVIEEPLKGIYHQAMRVFHGRASSVKAVVSRMRAIHQRAVLRPADAFTTATWIAAYGLVVALALAATVFHVQRLLHGGHGGW